MERILFSIQQVPALCGAVFPKTIKDDAHVPFQARVHVEYFLCRCVFRDAMERLGRNRTGARESAKKGGGPKVRRNFCLNTVSFTYQRKLSWQTEIGGPELQHRAAVARISVV